MRSVDCKVVSHFSNSWTQKLDDVIMFYVHGSSAGTSMSTVERKRFFSPGVSAGHSVLDLPLYWQCDCGQGSCALTIFLLRQLLMTPIYHTRWTLMMICTWKYFISYKVMPNANSYLYRKTLLVVEDKLISRKQISPWLLRFEMDLDFVSSSIFCWVIFLKFYLDFILAKEFWQGSHRNKLQLGENFRFQIYPRNVLKR